MSTSAGTSQRSRHIESRKHGIICVVHESFLFISYFVVEFPSGKKKQTESNRSSANNVLPWMEPSIHPNGSNILIDEHYFWML